MSVLLVVTWLEPTVGDVSASSHPAGIPDENSRFVGDCADNGQHRRMARRVDAWATRCANHDDFAAYDPVDAYGRIILPPDAEWKNAASRECIATLTPGIFSTVRAPAGM